MYLLVNIRLYCNATIENKNFKHLHTTFKKMHLTHGSAFLIIFPILLITRKHFPNRANVTNHFSSRHDDNHKHHHQQPREIQFNHSFGSHSASAEFLQHLSYKIHQNMILRINFVRKGKKTAKVSKMLKHYPPSEIPYVLTGQVPFHSS